VTRRWGSAPAPSQKLEEQEKLYILSALSATAAIFSESVSASFFFSGDFDAFLVQKYSDLFDKSLRLIARRF
jgi:hypothetical protein